MTRRALLLVCCFLSMQCLQAQTVFTLEKDGEWRDSSIWSPQGVPDSADIAIIDSWVVSIPARYGEVKVDSILITNQGNKVTELIIESRGQLTARTIHILGTDKDKDLSLQVFSEGELNVLEDLRFERASNNNKENKVQLYAKNGQVTVDGNVSLLYGDSKGGENQEEFYLVDTSMLTISGDLEMVIEDGKEAELLLDNLTRVEVSGSLVLQSNKDNSDIKVTVGTGSELEVEQNITFRAMHDKDVKMNFTGGSSLRIGGNFLRPTNYGSLSIDDGSTLVYDGNGAQTIACNTMPSAGSDGFEISKVIFANTSNTPMTVEGELTVTDHLDLSGGIIQTSETSMLIVESGATIGAGSSTAFVDGPMLKRGETKGASFIFPVGNNGRFAPLEISAVSDATAEYQVQYFSDPPPIEDGISPPLGNMSTSGFWGVSKSGGAPDVNISLHWTDSTESGVSTPDSLLVAGLTNNSDGSKTWESYGNSGTTTAGAGGSVTSAMSDPPPLDDVTMLTLGSTSTGANALPVEFAHFEAAQIGDAVLLSWETLLEENADRFVVQRSLDGKSYRALGALSAQGNSYELQSYQFNDRQPEVGTNYYRLKQMDVNGQYQYSKVVSVTIATGKQALQLFPNPTRNLVTVTGFARPEKMVTVQVNDQLGRILFNGVLPVDRGQLKLTTDQLNIREVGVYWLRIGQGQELRNLRLFKLDK